jgi:predicted house-cleaning NTP pyrophosphatase (Maf/HAM1 superfamily)
MGTEPEIIGKELRTPRAAAVAGVAFSLLLGASLVLIRISVPGDPSDAREWLTDSGRRHSVLTAIALVWQQQRIVALE